MVFKWLFNALFRRRRHSIPTDLMDTWKDTTTPKKEKPPQSNLKEFGAIDEKQRTLDEWVDE